MNPELVIPQDLFALAWRLDAPLFQCPNVWNREGQWTLLREDSRGSSGSWVLPAWWVWVVCVRALPPWDGVSEFGTKAAGDRWGRF